jgi:hypothetical protein
VGKLRLVYSALRGEFAQALKAKYRSIAEAATGAILLAAAEVKVKARADIAAAGFSRGWQYALRVEVSPRRPRVSANAAAYVFHKIDYAGVFEEGAHIRGDPYLWLPLDGAPARVGRFRITPRLYNQRVGPLDFIPRPGKPPLLAARVRATRRRLEKKVSLRLLRRGTEAKRGEIRSIPMFVGIKATTIRARFHISRIVQEARDRLAEFYFESFKDK